MVLVELSSVLHSERVHRCGVTPQPAARSNDGDTPDTRPGWLRRQWGDRWIGSWPCAGGWRNIPSPYIHTRNPDKCAGDYYNT